MVKTKLFRKILLQKKSRFVENAFLKKWASDKKTLEIGGKDKGNSIYFPQLTVVNIEDGPGVDMIVNAEDMHEYIADESFDVVLCLSVLEHTKDPRKVVAEIQRVLTTGGLAIISVPFVMTLHDTPYDYWRFTKYGVQELFSSFEEIEILNNLDSLQTIGYMYHRLFLQTRVLHTRVLSILFWCMSKVHYFFHHIISDEYGYANHSKKEEAVLANNILAVFKKQ